MHAIYNSIPTAYLIFPLKQLIDISNIISQTELLITTISILPSKWYHYQPNCLNLKPRNYPWFLPFPHHPQKVCLNLYLKHIFSSPTSLHIQCCHPGPSHHMCYLDHGNSFWLELTASPLAPLNSILHRQPELSFKKINQSISILLWNHLKVFHSIWNKIQISFHNL